jgi:hypothetical protein
MSDETDDDVNSQPTTPVGGDTFAAVADLLALIVDPKATGARLRSLQSQQAAAAKAAAELATERAAFEQETARVRAELDADRTSLEKRRVGVSEAECSVARREEYIAGLEKQWKFMGETDPLVLSGLRSPEHGTPVQKARRAYGIDPPLEDDVAPEPGCELTREIDGVPFPSSTTITRELGIHVRSRHRTPRSRAEQ